MIKKLIKENVKKNSIFMKKILSIKYCINLG